MTEYNLRYPVSQKATYRTGDNIDFVLTFPNLALVGNSIRLTGNLDVYKTGNTAFNPGDKVYYDAFAGIHSFFNNITVSCQTKGTIETQSEYPRWIKMKNTATKPNSQIVSNSKSLLQLLYMNSEQTNDLIRQYTLPFSCDLDICLNNVVSSTPIPYNNTGDITISLRIVQALEALFGPDMTNDVNFTISDFACEYLTVPIPQPTQPIAMLATYYIKQIINSSNSVINVKLPAVVNRVSCTFMRVAEELQLTYNNIELEQPEGISKLYYSFNDSTNTFISYPIESVEDILEHYLLSFINDDTKHDVTVRKINDNKVFGVGLNFEEGINLQTSSFGLNIISNINNNEPYNIYAYFKGIISL